MNGKESQRESEKDTPEKDDHFPPEPHPDGGYQPTDGPKKPPPNSF